MEVRILLGSWGPELPSGLRLLDPDWKRIATCNIAADEIPRVDDRVFFQHEGKMQGFRVIGREYHWVMLHEYADVARVRARVDLKLLGES